MDWAREHEGPIGSIWEKCADVTDCSNSAREGQWLLGAGGHDVGGFLNPHLKW